MNQLKMMTLRGTAVSRKSNDEILKDIMITLMIAAAISLFMCYLPVFVDAASKSSSGGGTVSKIISALTQGIYDEVKDIAKPIAAICLVIYGIFHLGRPGSTVDRMIQGWPTKIIFGFAIVAFGPTIMDSLEKLMIDNGLFIWKS